MLSKVGEDAPVVSLVGDRQSRPRDFAAETHVVEFAAHRAETRLNITEAFTVGELGESHCKILIPARETPVIAVAAIAADALLKLAMRKVGNQLREDGAAGVHPPLFRRGRANPARTGRYQFKSFFGRIPLSD